MRRLPAFAALVCTAVAVACGGGDDPTAPSGSNDPARTPTVTPPSFDYAEHPSGMWINTDKNDYSPGDRVIFTGGGWQPGDTLDIRLTNDSTHAERQWTIAVDAAGAFTDSTYLVSVADLNLAFTLTATSRANPEQTLTVNFTDGTLSLTAPVHPAGFQSFPYASGNLTFTARNATTGSPSGTHTNVKVRIRLAGNLNPTAPQEQRTLDVTSSLAENNTASVVWDGNDGSAIPLAENLYGVRAFSTQSAEPNNAPLQIVVDRTAPTISASPAPNVSPNQATPGLPGVAVVFTATVNDPVVAGVNANHYRVITAEYRIDNGSWLAMAAADGNFNNDTEAVTATIPAATVATLTAQPHLVCVRATDRASNRSADLLSGNANCATLTIAAVDNVPPTVTNVSASPNPGNTGSATLTATATDALSNITGAEYRVGADSWTAMTAQDGSFNSKSEVVTASLSSITEGSHQVCVRATDAASNTSDGTACITLVVDKTAPVVTNVAAVPNPGNTGNAVLTATATDVLTNITGGEYKIGAGNWTPMAAQDGSFDSKSEGLTASLAGLAEGMHSVCVRATDQVANTSDGTACITLVVDLTPPVVSGVSASPNPGKTGNATLTASATDLLTNVAGAEYKIGAGSWTTMDAQDGTFDSKTEALTVNLTGVPEGENQVCVRATDAAGNTSVGTGTACITLVVDQTPPVISNVSASPNPVSSGAVTVTATATDALTKVLSGDYKIDSGAWSSMDAADGGFDEKQEGLTATIPAATIAVLSDGEHDVCVRATDEVDNTSAGTGAACIKLVVDHTPPAISNFNVSPNPVAVNTPFTISATFTDALTNVKGAEYSLGGTGGPWVALPSASGTAPYDDSKTEHGTITFSLPNADVLDVCVRSTDHVNNTNQVSGTNPIQCIFLAVYDPTAGFVTGGGWIDSPSNACPIFCLGAAGKATFGFVSKYISQKDKTTPVLTGSTEFQFHAGNVNFKSTNYEWLVVSQNGIRAQYKGTGTVNGVPGYGFLLTALESPDRFRMKIWDASGTIYDNQWEKADSGNDATVLGGGSIIIHVPKK